MVSIESRCIMSSSGERQERDAEPLIVIDLGPILGIARPPAGSTRADVRSLIREAVNRNNAESQQHRGRSERNRERLGESRDESYMADTDTGIEQMGNNEQEQPVSRKRRADEIAVLPETENAKRPAIKEASASFISLAAKTDNTTSAVKPATRQVMRNKNRCVPLVPTPAMCSR